MDRRADSLRNELGLRPLRNLTFLWLGLMMALAACAGMQPPVSVSPEKSEAVIDMTASNFKFVPNNIRAYKGDELIFRIRNVSGTEHNFTINNPEGKRLQSVTLVPGETTEVKVPLQEAGIYEFHCDKPFHASLGMEGQVEAAPRQ
jgi:uncharacterized cupredoxin-like copper-binding protein